ncbi:dolichyl-P-Glc:Glc1Man(9)GlcNAc(2)-PP-dolichol alpha-1,3-glucosyltransferase [Ascoidea rubescens DSM 1968]|uniref:Alpha-1,3-glucosyltransferase n=1 Tax=Ascoidea rubescens DSM 1968 TaxID=1344418 RepID=A0A1D2VCE4_9ASCO|nr:glycosyltransferase family 57 protein [Ascoidea rubescens DSM 1968]ODV59279.1 glycosyltransferase family 57 protein [Ascoidea rubescens DSM 1968]
MPKKTRESRETTASAAKSTPTAAPDSSASLRRKPRSKAPTGHPTKKKFSLINIWIAGACLKILLFTAYYSTDFDVHRNWLAITHNLPLKDWYLEHTSQWTLDYPPFFAYFEWALSQFVPQIVKDDGCLSIVEVGNFSVPTVYFQRSTVIVSEILLFLSLQWYIKSSELKEKQKSFVVASSIVLSPGFLMIDHIHFQYNGLLFGLLICSIVSAKNQKFLQCGFFFAVSLCFKHIFLYLAPAFFIFLLRSCLNIENTKNLKGLKKRKCSNLELLFKLINWKRLFGLAIIVISVFTVSFGPFVYYGVTNNLFRRLFPFSRGLTHAYWAPNIWAIYSFIDRLLIQLCLNVPIAPKILNKLGFAESTTSAQSIKSLMLNSSSTKGLVQDIEFVILPNVPPSLTFFLTIFYQFFSFIPLFIKPTFNRFIGCLTLCGYSSFLFGWHVHEKAVLLIIIPYSFLVIKDKRLLLTFDLLIFAGYVSLFPLLIKSNEWVIKVLYTYVWLLIFYKSFDEICSSSSSLMTRRVFYLDRLILMYIIGFIPLVLICSFLDIFAIKIPIIKKLEFLRLMAYSVYCSVGIVSSWCALNWLYFLDESLWN